MVGSASSNSGVRAVFSVRHGVVGGEHRAFIVEEFIKDGGSPVAVISLRGDTVWPPRLPDLTPCDFFLWGYLKAKVYEQRPQTLEAPKEAIR